MSRERGRRRQVFMREHGKETVVVIGAGLAGLTAAATGRGASRSAGLAGLPAGDGIGREVGGPERGGVGRVLGGKS
jgi:hypothetical protein